jgi:nitrogen PTS system EIIA component
MSTFTNDGGYCRTGLHADDALYAARYTIERLEIETIDSIEKYDAIRELIAKSNMYSALQHKDIFENEVIARERKMSTAIGRGVAVAHGKTIAVTKTMVALGISKRGIRFDSPDGLPVNFLFVVANPPHLSDEYLGILSAIARVTSDETFRNELLGCDCVCDRNNKITRALALSVNEKNLSMKSN